MGGECQGGGEGVKGERDGRKERVTDARVEGDGDRRVTCSLDRLKVGGVLPVPLLEVLCMSEC